MSTDTAHGYDALRSLSPPFVLHHANGRLLPCRAFRRDRQPDPLRRLVRSVSCPSASWWGALLSCSAPRVLRPRYHPLDRSERGCSAASQGWRGSGECLPSLRPLSAPRDSSATEATPRATGSPRRPCWAAISARLTKPSSGSLIDGLSSQPEVDAEAGWIAPQSDRLRFA